MIGICGVGVAAGGGGGGVGGASRSLSPNASAVANLTTGSALNNNYDYDFTSDDHIEEQNIGILNSNNSNIRENNNDTVNQSVNNQTNTLEDENLVQKIQQSLENFKKAKTENIAWVTRLQSKKIFFSLLFYVKD